MVKREIGIEISYMNLKCLIWLEKEIRKQGLGREEIRH